MPGLDHPYAWYALVKDKKTGKEHTYWINGNHLNREAVAEHLRTHFHGVETLSIYQCAEMPGRILKPVPPSHFEFGIREKLEKLLAPEPAAKPISIQPIKRQPLFRR